MQDLRVYFTLAAAMAAMLVAAPSAPAATNHISRVAGVFQPGFSGDGGPAMWSRLSYPDGVDAMADGGFLIADTLNERIRRVAPDGTISTVAGTGARGFSGDGGPATAARLNQPADVAALPGGGFLIADTSNLRIRRVAPDGTIATVAGSDTNDRRDGIPATSARVFQPRAVAALPDGGFLYAAPSEAKVRRVLPDGTVTTVAGGNGEGFSGDGGPATAAQLRLPTDVAVTADGGFLIADSGNRRVRRVAPDQTIATVAGSDASVHGPTGDGGPATAAAMGAPWSVAATPGGGFLIADMTRHVVRWVSPDGVISTVAGNGTPGVAGNGVPATSAQLNHPRGVALTAGGGFLIADLRNSQIRFVDADLIAPDTTITAGPSGVHEHPNVTNDQRPRFEFSSSEDGSTFACRVDNGPWGECSSPHRTGKLADGEHSFEAGATDAAGNTDPTPASMAFTVAPKCSVIRLVLPLPDRPTPICVLPVYASGGG